jgi:hypothetical protein
MATVLVQWNHTGDETNFRLYKVHKAAADSSLTSGALVETAAGGVDMVEGVDGDGTGLAIVAADTLQYEDNVASSSHLHSYYSLRANNDAGNSAPATLAADPTEDYLHVTVAH